MLFGIEERGRTDEDCAKVGTAEEVSTTMALEGATSLEKADDGAITADEGSEEETAGVLSTLKVEEATGVFSTLTVDEATDELGLTAALELATTPGHP
jgi:hypothetical protein